MRIPVPGIGSGGPFIILPWHDIIPLMIPMLIAIGFVAAAAMVVAVVVGGRWKARARLMEPLPPQWVDIMGRNVGLWRAMPADLKLRLCGLVRLFLARIRFEGCGGMVVDDEVRLTIAANACLLLLGRGERIYPRLSTVLVYPDAFYVRRERPLGDGVLSAEELLSGEAWRGGPVIIAWNEVRSSSAGSNVIIHEFAHVIDQGVELLPPGEVDEWARALGEEFDALRRAAEGGMQSVLDDYGATSEAEFFAVAAEVFFERPALLKRKLPRLYRRLSEFYALEPADWQL